MKFRLIRLDHKRREYVNDQIPRKRGFVACAENLRQLVRQSAHFNTLYVVHRPMSSKMIMIGQHQRGSCSGFDTTSLQQWEWRAVKISRGRPGIV